MHYLIAASAPEMLNYLHQKNTEPATRFIFEALPIIFVLNSLPCCARGGGKKKGNEQQQDSAMSFSAKSVKHAQKTGIKVKTEKFSSCFFPSPTGMNYDTLEKGNPQ